MDLNTPEFALFQSMFQEFSTTENGDRVVVLLGVNNAQMRTVFELGHGVLDTDFPVESKFDHLPEQAFYMVGGREDVEKRAAAMKGEAA